MELFISCFHLVNQSIISTTSTDSSRKRIRPVKVRWNHSEEERMMMCVSLLGISRK